MLPKPKKDAETLKESICDITGSRQQAKTQYPLSAILMVALLASFTREHERREHRHLLENAQELARIIDDFPLEAPFTTRSTVSCA